MLLRWCFQEIKSIGCLLKRITPIWNVDFYFGCQIWYFTSCLVISNICPQGVIFSILGYFHEPVWPLKGCLFSFVNLIRLPKCFKKFSFKPWRSLITAETEGCSQTSDQYSNRSVSPEVNPTTKPPSFLSPEPWSAPLLLSFLCLIFILSD